MIAPRAVIALGNPGYEWLGDESGYKSMMAATEVWKAMGIEDRIGFDFTGNHEHCQAASSQNSSVTAFVDKFLRNKSANTDIHVKPTNGKGFKIDNYADWIDWKTPSLPYEEAKLDTSKKDTSTTSLKMNRLAPSMNMHIVGNTLEVLGAPEGSKVRLFDLQGNLVREFSEKGGSLAGIHVGKLTAILVNRSGQTLGYKSFSYTGLQ